MLPVLPEKSYSWKRSLHVCTDFFRWVHNPLPRMEELVAHPAQGSSVMGRAGRQPRSSGS